MVPRMVPEGFHCTSAFISAEDALAQPSAESSKFQEAASIDVQGRRRSGVGEMKDDERTRRDTGKRNGHRKIGIVPEGHRRQESGMTVFASRVTISYLNTLFS